MDGESVLGVPELFYACLSHELSFSAVRVSIDGDKEVEHDNEQSPKASGTTQKSIEQAPEVGSSKQGSIQNIDSDQKPVLDVEQQHLDLTPSQTNTSNPDHGIKSLEESMINRLGFLPAEDGDLEQTEDGKTLYIVFSTDCGAFQHWQSYLLFFSAVRIRQPGFITRIASGCTEEEKQEAKEWYQTHIQGEFRFGCFIGCTSLMNPIHHDFSLSQ